MNDIASIWPSMPKTTAKTIVLDEAPIAVFWIDESGHIGYVNNQLCILTSYSYEALIKQKLEILIPSANPSNWHNEWWPKLKKDSSISHLSAAFRHHNGMIIERNISASLVEIAGINFAAFYIWPLVSTTKITHSSSTHLLQKLNECVCLLDKTGIVHYANPALCRKLKVLTSDIIGHSLLQFLIPAQFQLQNIWQTLQQDSSSEIEFECQNISGDTLFLRMNVVPEQNQFLVSFVDITEQHFLAKELEEKSARLERLGANIPGFIYKFKMAANGDFSFPYASMGCQEIFGVDPADVVYDATPIINTIHPDDIQMFLDSVLASANMLSPWNHEARLSTIENEWKWFHAASRPELQDNGDIIWEGLVMDVTDRKQAEGELAKAKENAEALATAKEAFLFNMSHEIRTPLNAIIGLTDLALKTGLTSVQYEYINKVLSSSKVLLGIVNNVLDFSKIEAGKLQVEHIEFSLSSVLQNVGIIVEAQAAEKGLELLIDNYSKDYENLIGDPLRLEQILINFCNNAIKFTERGEIIISVQPVEEQNEFIKLKLMVKDTGIGLSKNQQQTIFDSFTQADNSTTRKYGGTGLGLTICRQIVTLLGGEIGVESEVNKGSTFYFTARFSKVAKPSQQKDLLSFETKKKRLLIVDENTKSAKLLVQMLTSSGLQVSAVHCRKDVIESLNETVTDPSLAPYDLIIIDWKISSIDGIKTLQQIKQIQGYANTPIMIMISTYALDHFKSLSSENLIHSFINKPLIKPNFLAAIENVFIDKTSLTEYKPNDLADTKNIEKSFNGCRVLLAEDNIINQEIAKKILQSKGIEVLVVNNGREAVELLLANKNKMTIDAIFMDIQMPEMDGFEATRIIRNNPAFDTLPIIAMTAHVFAAEKEKCLAAGMQFHVSKPIEPLHLFNTLADAIKTKINLSSTENSFPTSVTTNLSSLSELSTVDIDAAVIMLDGDEALLNKLLHNFADEHAATITDLKHHISLQQHPQAAKLIHTLKGIAGNLHIKHVYNSAIQIEKALKNNSLQSLTALVNQFDNDFNQFINEINQLNSNRVLNNTDKQSKLNEDINISANMLKLLNDLIFHLDNNNFKAQSCLEELSPFLSQHCQNELNQLSELITKLDFSAAADIARILKIKLSK